MGKRDLWPWSLDFGKGLPPSVPEEGTRVPQSPELIHTQESSGNASRPRSFRLALSIDEETEEVVQGGTWLLNCDFCFKRMPFTPPGAGKASF